MATLILDDPLRKQARVLHFAALVIVLAAVINILRASGLFPFLFAVIGGDGAAEGEALLSALIGLLPVFFYAAAVAMAGRIFDRVSKGEVFSRRNSGALGSVGGNVMFGAVSALLVAPVLHAWTNGEVFDLSFEPANMLLIVVGGLIQMLGFVHARATALRAELDEIV